METIIIKRDLYLNIMNILDFLLKENSLEL